MYAPIRFPQPLISAMSTYLRLIGFAPRGLSQIDLHALSAALRATHLGHLDFFELPRRWRHGSSSVATYHQINALAARRSPVTHRPIIHQRVGGASLRAMRSPTTWRRTQSTVGIPRASGVLNIREDTGRGRRVSRPPTCTRTVLSGPSHHAADRLRRRGGGRRGLRRGAGSGARN